MHADEDVGRIDLGSCLQIGCNGALERLFHGIAATTPHSCLDHHQPVGSGNSGEPAVVVKIVRLVFGDEVEAFIGGHTYGLHQGLVNALHDGLLGVGCRTFGHGGTEKGHENSL
jgi:hypothetical protein